MLTYPNKLCLLAAIASVAQHATAGTTTTTSSCTKSKPTSSCLKGKETLLAPLATNSAVLSFCSSAFPVPPVTTTVTTTNTITSTSTDLESTTTTLTVTETVEETQTSTVTINGKRDLDERSQATKAPAKPPAVANFVALCANVKAEISHICSCFETPRTVTQTVTASTTTVPVVTTTTTTTATATATYTDEHVVVSTSTQSPPFCSATPNTLGTGGCSSNCYCDTRAQDGMEICNDSIACGRSCSSDTDCPLGQGCINDSSTGPCGGPTCVDYSGCSSSYTPSKRSLEFMRGGQDSKFVKRAADSHANLLGRDGTVVGAMLSRPDTPSS